MYQNTVEYRAVQRLVALKRAICQRIDTMDEREAALECERLRDERQNNDRLILVDGHMWRE